MKNNTVSVIHESDTGRNQKFKDNQTGRELTREEFVEEIRKGNYSNYHIRNIGGVDTPVSNPDSTRNNNLG